MAPRSFSDFLRGAEDPIDPGCTLSEILLRSLRQYKDAAQPAQVDTSTGVEMSFPEFLKQSVCAAEGWRALGLQVGDIIVISAKNYHNVFPALVGAIFNGCTVACPVPTYTKDELKHALNLCNPKVVLSEKANLQMCIEVAPNTRHISLESEGCPSGVMTYASLLQLGENADPNTYRPASITDIEGHVSCILYSSGTTGMPKGVMIRDRAIAFVLYNYPIVSDPNVDGPSKILVTSQLCWMSGLLVLHRGIQAGETRYFMTTNTETTILEAMEKYRIHTWTGAPTVVISMAAIYKTHKYDLSSVHCILCGGSPLAADIHKTLSEEFGTLIMQVYGSTEILMVTADWFSQVQYGSMGFILNGVHVRLVDVDTGKEIDAPNVVGECRVKSPYLMKGYIGNPEATAEVFDEKGFYKTGDSMYVDENGRFFFVDRLKEMLKYRNQQISPAEVEAVLLQHPDVIDACVLGKADVKNGDLPTAFIVRRQNSSVTEQELDQLVSSKLSDHKRLRGGVIFMQELPRTITGKTARKQLKQYLQKTSA